MVSVPMTVKGMRCLLLSRSSKDKGRSTCGIGGINFCVNIFSINHFDSVISSKHYIVKDVIESSIEYSESVCGRSLELRYHTILAMGVR